MTISGWTSDRMRSCLIGIVMALVLVGCASGGPAGTPTPTIVVPPVRSPAGGVPVGYGTERADWVGVWSGREPDISGYSDTVTVLQADGSFSSQSSNATVGSLVTLWGQWDVFNLTGTPFLRFAVEGHEPQEWCGPLGCNAVIVPTGMTRYFRFVTTDEVLMRDETCADPSCEVRYTR